MIESEVWEEPGIVLGLRVYEQIGEGILDFVIERINAAPMTTFPPYVFVVSPPSAHNTLLDISLWPIAGDFGPQTQHQLLGDVGKKLAIANIQICIAFIVVEVWTVHRTEPIKPDINLEMEPDRKEAISIVGCDIAKRFSRASIYLDRDMDTNALIVGKVEKQYSSYDAPPLQMESSLIRSLMLGYTEAIHIMRYGVPVDPTDPYKYVHAEQRKTGA